MTTGQNSPAAAGGRYVLELASGAFGAYLVTASVA